MHISPKIFLRHAILTGTSGALAVILSGCGKQSAMPPQMPPPIVTIAPVQEQEVTEWDEFTGRTEAVESVEVRPRVSGHIMQVLFQSGQLVKKGDILFQIDSRPYAAIYALRQAEYAQAKAHLDNAKIEAERRVELLSSKAISKEEGQTSQSESDEAQAALQAAAANLESARLDLEFTQVRSPIDGRVSRALLTEGNFVSGVAGTAALLTTIVSVDPIYVYADVDENSLLKFNALADERKKAAGGDPNAKVPVELELADEDGFPHKGTIESFDNRLDQNTGTILLRAVFPNPEGRMVPGLFAHIRMSAGGKHPAMLVDESAIGTDQAQKYVLTLSGSNTVQYRAVTLGPSIDGKRIVRTGLQPGEKIVVNGLQRCRPGMPVNPEEQTAAIPQAEGKTAQR